MSGHTPGPWTLRHQAVSMGPGVTGQRAYAVGADGREVSGTIHHADEVTVYRGEAQLQESERKARLFPTYVTGEPFPFSANAHLIAAAPDLLSALIALVNHPGPCPKSHKGCAKGRAAIAKAEGK